MTISLSYEPFNSSGRSRMALAERNNYYGMHEPIGQYATPSSEVSDSRSSLADVAHVYSLLAAGLAGRPMPIQPMPEPEPVTERGGFGMLAVRYGIVRAKPKAPPKSKRAKQRQRAKAKSRHRVRK